MSDVVVTVRATVRDAQPSEVAEGLERNPGSSRLAERGWLPAWFEAELQVDGSSGEHLHSLIWIEPGRTPHEVAEEELEHALDEALRNLRDYEGVEVWPEDVTERELSVQVGGR